MRTAAEVSSTRTLDRLRTLQRQLRLLRTSSRYLNALDERITERIHRDRPGCATDTLVGLNRWLGVTL